MIFGMSVTLPIILSLYYYCHQFIHSPHGIHITLNGKHRSIFDFEGLRNVLHRTNILGTFGILSNEYPGFITDACVIRNMWGWIRTKCFK